MIPANPILGTGLHAIGAAFAALCYTPQRRVNGWSWQSYWLIQASVCWFLLPILGAWLTVPDLGRVLLESPRGCMETCFVLGAAYGVGGTAFGIAIRHIGFSLTYAIAVGLSTVLGTLIPPLVSGDLPRLMSQAGAGWVMGGIATGIAGISLAGLAGRMKEKDLSSKAGLAGFSLAKGLLLSLLAGVLSAVYGLSLAAGEPIARVAAAHGAGVFQGNVVYIFANTGAFVSAGFYCLWLHFRHGTLSEMVELPAGNETARLPVNWSMALLTGVLWYGQFFFYNLGHVHMGAYQFTSWAIHMIMLILFSIVVGFLLNEWQGARRFTRIVVGLAFGVLACAVLFLTYGNRMGELAGHH